MYVDPSLPGIVICT